MQGAAHMGTYSADSSACGHHPPVSCHPALSRRASDLEAVLDDYPAVEAAFGYGSGVFHQPGLYSDPSAAASSAAPSPGPLLDLIFAVRCARQWHAQVRL
jgi:Phosphatidate cytidylyltransferase, mitochondrial